MTITGASSALDAAATPTTVPRELADVFSALGPAVLGYLHATGCPGAEDVLSEVFVRVARALRSFDGSDTNLRSWVFTIAYRCLADHHRSAHRQRLLSRRVLPAAPAPPPDEPFDPALVAALNALTAEQREVVTLRFVADLSLDDVSRITNKPLGAVKSLQHRGLLVLRTLLPGERVTQAATGVPTP